MKDFAPIVFDQIQCGIEIERLGELLRQKGELAERSEIQPLFRSSPQLSAFLGTLHSGIGPANRIAFEFQVFGDHTADLIVGNSATRTYCAIEFEDARANSIFQSVSGKATREWGRRFEHGFSQLVDWFYSLEDHRPTAAFTRCFGHGQIEFAGLLVIGRSKDLSEYDQGRLRWRTSKVTVNSHKVYCRTYDDLYESLSHDWRLVSQNTRSL